MQLASMDELKIRVDTAIEDGDALVYDTAAECGQIVGNVRHMTWFRNAVMRAYAENYGEYAHLAEALA